jgi:hypothetical protein
MQCHSRTPERVTYKVLLLLQISDHLEIGKDESDEDKINALSAVHSVGDTLWVKVGVSQFRYQHTVCLFCHRVCCASRSICQDHFLNRAGCGGD